MKRRIFYAIVFIVLTLVTIPLGRIKLAAFFHNKGVEYFDKDDYKEANSYFKKALKIYPESLQSRVELAKSYSLLNMHDEAVWEYKKIISSNDAGIDVYSGIISEYLEVRDYENSYSAVHEALSLFPDNKKILNLSNVVSSEFALYLTKKAEEELSHQKINSALSLYEKAISLSPGLALPYLNSASIYIMLGEIDAAKNILETFILKNNSNSFAFKLLGDINMSQNNYVLASENYKRAIAIEPDYAEAYNGIALSYNYMGYYSSSLEMVEKAYELRPYDEYVLYNLGKIYRDNRRFNEALSAFIKLKSINPDFTYLNEALAEIYFLTGEDLKAKELLNLEIIKVAREYSQNKDKKSLLKLVYLNFMNKDYDGVNLLINNAVKEGRDFEELHYFQGKIWEEKGNLLQASQEYEKAIRSRFGDLARKKYYDLFPN